MKILKITVLAMVMATFMSCGGSSTKAVNAEGFGALEKELKDKFGDDAHYTDLSVGYIDQIGMWVNTTVTDKPESLKMGEWNLSQNAWKQTSEIKLEVSEGSKASDFMYQLGDNFSLKKLGELVEKSMTSLTAEKNLKNPALSLAHIKFPDNGDTSKAEYVVQLKPENGGTSFNYSYKLNGELIEMDY